ncbi:stage III sporulation protein AA [Paenibacillus eucommiae]|uniref:Stage III sporulation protein AA n=1 Tax=Paenibacillus eucommiae TaxID=1355755 RepID=A0ABS4INA3_9BACL|nr:stage III sporulation protein AA [Paenibacillus eucommiae]MBP1989052.1 stage III sporulation protein AA [Paenibacillus eucommiae]
MLESIVAILPPSLRFLVSQLSREVQADLEEIRIRERRPLEICFGNRYSFVSGQGKLVQDEHQAYLPGYEDCSALLELLTNHSLYTFEEQLKKGFITIAGGHRVGLAGRTVLEHGEVKQIRDVSSFNIRIARDVQGVGKPIIPYLYDPEFRSVHHTLVISPPQQGKTTLIRDLARLISRGAWGSMVGRKVGIIDERSELAACVKGVPRFDLGPRTDVMDGCPKAEGMMMMIRSLSPEVLIVDEIGRAEDATAIYEAMHAGIRVIASAHGAGLSDIRQRPVLQDLIREGVFMRYVTLGRRRGEAASFQVFDGKGQQL